MLLPTEPKFLWTALHRQYRWKIFCHVLGSFKFAGHNLTPFLSPLRILGLHRAAGWLRPQGPQGGGLQEHSGHQAPAGAIQGCHSGVRIQPPPSQFLHPWGHVPSIIQKQQKGQALVNKEQQQNSQQAPEDRLGVILISDLNTSENLIFHRPKT